MLQNYNWYRLIYIFFTNKIYENIYGVLNNEITATFFHSANQILALTCFKQNLPPPDAFEVSKTKTKNNKLIFLTLYTLTKQHKTCFKAVVNQQNSFLLFSLSIFND